TLRSLDAADGSLTLWDVATGERLRQTEGLRPTRVERGVTSGQFSSRGGLMALSTAGDGDRSEHLICDSRSGKTTQRLRAGDGTGPCSFSPDESQLAVRGVDGHTVETVNLRQNAVRFRWEVFTPLGFSWSPNGRLLAAAGAGNTSDGGN